MATVLMALMIMGGYLGSCGNFWWPPQLLGVKDARLKHWAVVEEKPRVKEVEPIRCKIIMLLVFMCFMLGLQRLDHI